MAGDIAACSLVGALNAVELSAERDRWFEAYLDSLKMSPTPALRDASSGFDAARRLAKAVGRKMARRWIERSAREARKWTKRRLGSVESTAVTTRTKAQLRRGLDSGWRGCEPPRHPAQQPTHRRTC